jgi:hypothetical protein
MYDFHGKDSFEILIDLHFDIDGDVDITILFCMDVKLFFYEDD